MSVLRKLSMIYMLCALAFSTAILFEHDPALEQASRKTVAAALDAIRDHVAAPVARLAQSGIARVVAALSLPDKTTPSPVAPPAKTAAVPKPAPIVIPIPGPLPAPEPSPATAAVPEATVPDLQVADDEFGPAPKLVKVSPAHLPPKLALAPLRPAGV